MAERNMDGKQEKAAVSLSRARLCLSLHVLSLHTLNALSAFWHTPSLSSFLTLTLPL